MKELIEQIKQYRKILGEDLVMPAHHYQRPEVVALSDFAGDSYKLAVEASRHTSDFILFCGVRFMAEGASVLAADNQKIVVPELLAGCPMADMIDKSMAQKAYDIISPLSNRRIAPVVYMNSYADVKSFCGEKDGAVCTSSNALKICSHFIEKGEAVFFFPDFNLGINTADTLGLKDDEVVRIGRDLVIEERVDYRNVKMYLWDGFCHVHKVFTVDDVKKAREQYSGIKIIVHPESDRAVVQASDMNGSTAFILDSIRDSEPGSVWGVGTEINFVRRIASDFGPKSTHNKTIVALRDSPCFNMEKTSLEKVAASLKSIVDYKNGKGELVTEIRVQPEFKDGAKKALQTMMDIVQKA
ncbi:MAG: quinolinate synthase NadA [Spirochaetes bacterium]|nr:quinolinate synthase NadA [Spirochaetota bacterium]MBN2770170.1 quinolinate synthase NadA [Spirochaetota bacterium]